MKQHMRAVWMALAMSACGTPMMNPDADGGSGSDVMRPDVVSVQGPPVRDCVSRFVYPLGRQASSVAVAGQWNNFSQTADRLTDGLFTNTYRGAVSLRPGSYGYKFVADGQWSLDPNNAVSYYVDGVENSRLDVADCTVPTLDVVRRSVAADRTIEIELQYTDGTRRLGMNASSVSVVMNGTALPGSAITMNAMTARFVIRTQVSEDNKYTFRIRASDTGGTMSEERIVPMWVEREPFEWSDGTMYFAFTDRFRNGDRSNDSMIANVDARANYAGGDLAGVLSAINDGYFESLGVRTIWLSPVNDNTEQAGRGSDGRMYSGYHGYWVKAPRTVEEHFGTLETLRAVTAAAHKKGMRVLLDLVNNQLHSEHPYVRDHREWFNGDGTCVCGGANCDWDSHAIDCWFTNYLPDVNWKQMAAADQMVNDALFWLVEADVDGFRVDAVKHMDKVASTLLRHRIRQTLESGNAKYYLVGETFTGGDGHGLIKQYLSEQALWGQFDFPLYWAINTAFAENGGTMGDLDNATQTSEREFAGSIMSPFLGNHDVARFLSRASGQLRGVDAMQIAWTAPPPAPDSDEPYERLFLAFVFTLTQQGVPLIYSGDEVGTPGAADPDNRRMMKELNSLSPREAELLRKVKIVGALCAQHPGLRRGARQTLHTDGDGYVYARGANANLAIIAMNRGTTNRTVRVNVPASMASNGDVLCDVLSVPARSVCITVNGGGIDVPFTVRGASIFVR